MGFYGFINTALVGFFGFAAVHYFLLWWLSRRERVLLLFSLHCICTAILTCCVVVLLSSRSFAWSQFALDGRTTVGAVGICTTVWVMSLITGYQPRRYRQFVTITCVCIALINTFLWPLNGSVTGIESITLPWGEIVAIPDHGSPGWWGLPIYLLVVSIDLFGLLAAWHFWKSDRVGAILVAVINGTSLVSSLIAIQIDLYQVKMPYGGDISYAVGVLLIALLVSRSHRQAVDQLADRERTFQAIFDQTFEFIGLLSVDGIILRANQTALDFVGVTEDEVVGKYFWNTPWWTHSPPLQRQLQDAILAAVAGKTVRMQTTHRRFDGQLAYVDFSLKPVRDDTGRITLLIPEGRDITESKLAEEELCNSQSRFRLMTNEGRIVFWEGNPETLCFSYVSESAIELLGCPIDDWKVPGFWVRHLHPEDRDHAVATCVQATAEQQDHRFEYRMVRSDGRVVWVEDIVSVVIEEGRTVGVRGVMFDITDRKQAAAELHRQQQRFTELAALTPAAIYLYRMRPDGTSCFPYASPGIVDICGLQPEEVREDATPGLARVHPDDLERVMATMQASRQTLTLWEHEFRVHHPEKGLVWVEGRSIPSLEADGSVIWNGLLTDVTHRKTLTERMQQSQHMESIGRLAGGVAHDFNNLLTVINGYATLVLGGLPENSEAREPLRQIRSAGERAAALTRQLLVFSRREVQKVVTLELNTVVIEAEQMLRRLIGEDLQLRVDLHTGTTLVQADPNQLHQVLLNLAINARDAMPDGGELTIATTQTTLTVEVPGDTQPVPPGQYAVLSVRDTGAGIPPEIRSRIFEPYFTTKGVGKGTGLGLSVVHGIISHSNGYLTLDSTLGQGTTIQAWFPLAARPTVKASSPPEAVRAYPGREVILVVEDEASVRKIVEYSLVTQGYTVLTAEDGAAALKLANTHPGTIDLLLTDVVMPGMNGRLVAEKLREQRPPLKVLYMSGYMDDEVLQRGIREGTDAFLPKPFSPPQLLEKIRQLLDNRLDHPATASM